jgi:hypothetical protein
VVTQAGNLRERPRCATLNAAPVTHGGPAKQLRTVAVAVQGESNMTTKAQFTPEEWNSLLSAPALAALYVALASPGIVDSVKESLAAATAIAKAAQEAPANELMGALIADYKDQQGRQGARPQVEMKDPAQVKGDVLNGLRTVRTLLEAKATPDEASYLKQWLYQIAQDSANAAKEGDFLGIGGQRVSAEESAALREIADTLQVNAA